MRKVRGKQILLENAQRGGTVISRGQHSSGRRRPRAVNLLGGKSRQRGRSRTITSIRRVGKGGGRSCPISGTQVESVM